MTNAKVTGDKIEVLIEWISNMGKKGYFNSNTVNNKVNAIRNIASVLDAEEKEDLELLVQKMDDIVKRWATTSNAAPGSVPTIKSHAKSLIQDYLDYQRDPGKFKPKTRKPKTRTKLKKLPELKEPINSVPKAQTDHLSIEGQQLPDIHINIQIHISAEAPDSQIERIFESIAKHIYKK